MAAASDRSQHLFVVRVWHEVSHAAPIAQWRGSVEHVPSGRRQFFADLTEIDRFIRHALGEANGGPERAPPRALAPSHIALVQASFQQMLPHLEQTVARFYEILFARAPELRPLFGADLVALRGKFTTMLTVIVEALDNYARIEQIVQNLGRRHAGYGARRDHYALVGEALLRAIGEELGNEATTETLEAWAAAYTLLADTMLSAQP